MKLSEAMRLGAMLKPQAFGISFDGRGTCALGAAMDALGKLGTSIWIIQLRPDIRRFQVADCPVCGRVFNANGNQTIPHLNDDHKWTRERIADWVESLECAAEETAATPDLASQVSP